MTEKKDLRVIKSEKAIKKAFLELMQEKGYANITITDIANRAMINRKTFYMHYETKEELYETMVEELLDILENSEILTDLPQAQNKRNAVSNLLIQIKEHKEVFHTFIHDRTTSEFIDKLKERLKRDIITKSHIEERAKNSLFSLELLYETYFAVFMVILQWWADTDSVTTDYVIEMIIEFFSPKSLEMVGLNL